VREADLTIIMCRMSWKSGSLNLLELSGPHRACYGTASPFISDINWYTSQWPRGLGRRSTAARLLRSWVRIPPRAWMFVCCECCVLSGRGLCDGLVIRTEESYRMWRVVVCDHETSQVRRLKPTRGLQNTTPDGDCSARRKKKLVYMY